MNDEHMKSKGIFLTGIGVLLIGISCLVWAGSQIISLIMFHRYECTSFDGSTTTFVDHAAPFPPESAIGSDGENMTIKVDPNSKIWHEQMIASDPLRHSKPGTDNKN